MKTLNEHNKAVAAEHEQMTRGERYAGVACPDCGQEMAWAHPGGKSWSPGYQGMYLPGARIAVVCEACGREGTYTKGWGA